MGKQTVISLLILTALTVLQHPAKACDAATNTAFLHCMKTYIGPTENPTAFILSESAPSYADVLVNYTRNKRFENSSYLKPLLIITAKTTAHVQATVVCAQKTAPDYTLKIRSGGHDFDGLSYTSKTKFFILDVFNLRSITVDLGSQTAWVQAGATLGELYYRIGKESRVLGFPAGVCPTVGVGGHVSGGGYGNLIRKYGVSADNVVDALIVDVNGRLMDRRKMGEDLFWAIRGGGGGSFGVIVAYKVKLVAVPERVSVFLVQKYADEDAVGMLNDWQKVASVTSKDLFMRVLVQVVSSKKKKGEKTIRVSVMSLYLGDSGSLVELLGREFASLGLKKEDCKEMSWIESVLWWSNYDLNTTAPEVLLSRDYNSIYLKRKSDYVQNPIPINGINAIFSKMVALGKCGMVFNPYGGRMSEISSSAIAFPHRAGNLFKIQYSQNWIEGGEVVDSENLGIIRELYQFMTPYVSQKPRRSFLPYRDVDIGVMPVGENSVEIGRVYGEKYFEGNFDRLIQIKTAVDPLNFFRNEQSVPTL